MADASYRQKWSFVVLVARQKVRLPGCWWGVAVKEASPWDLHHGQWHRHHLRMRLVVGRGSWSSGMQESGVQRLCFNSRLLWKGVQTVQCPTTLQLLMRAVSCELSQFGDPSPCKVCFKSQRSDDGRGKKASSLLCSDQTGRDTRLVSLRLCLWRGLVFCSIAALAFPLLEKLCLELKWTLSRLRRSKSDACSCFLLTIIWGWERVFSFFLLTADSWLSSKG